jgi:hypothetical protein
MLEMPGMWNVYQGKVAGNKQSQLRREAVWATDSTTIAGGASQAFWSLHHDTMCPDAKLGSSVFNGFPVGLCWNGNVYSVQLYLGVDNLLLILQEFTTKSLL